MVATVTFEVSHEFEHSSSAVWNRLTDWAGHGDWIPVTRVEVGPEDIAAVGATFTAWTGVGPAAMPDRMVVSVLDWDPATAVGRCVVDKLGPVLVGHAGFTVTPTDSGSRVDWFEDVKVKRTPRAVGPISRPLSIRFFQASMRRLAKALNTAPDT